MEGDSMNRRSWVRIAEDLERRGQFYLETLYLKENAEKYLISARALRYGNPVEAMVIYEFELHLARQDVQFGKEQALDTVRYYSRILEDLGYDPEAVRLWRWFKGREILDSGPNEAREEPRRP